MKKIFLAILMIGIFLISFGQQNKGACKLEVSDVSKLISFGYLVGYTAEFKNNSSKTVDGIYWTTYYINNNGDYIKTESDSFNATDLVDPIQSGFKKSLVRAPRVKNASKLIIVINRVHFTDGTTCR
jgi:hypothetical protein